MRLLRRLRGDKGVTLVEMLVVVSILGIVLGIVSEGLMTAQHTMAQNASRLDGLSQTNTSVEAMTRVLRTAILPSQIQATCTGCDVAAFIEGDSTKVRFYANVDNDGILPASGATDRGPRRVTYKVENGELIETVQKPNSHDVADFNYQYCNDTSPSCPVRKRVIARDVVAGALFTYYDRTGAEISPPLQSDVSKLKAVDSIDLLLRVQPSDAVSSTTVTARVTLPNADSLIQPTPTAIP